VLTLQEESYEEDEAAECTTGLASKYRKKFAWDKFGGRAGARSAAIAWADEKRKEIKA
jgi:hypothetical protein